MHSRIFQSSFHLIMKRSISLIFALVFIVVVGLLRGVLFKGGSSRDALPSFEDCVRAGNRIVEEVPRKCVLPDARIVVEGANVASVTASLASSLPPHSPNTVFVFFGNTVRDPQLQKCAVTYPVERTLPKGADTLRFALEELMKGPTDADVQEGAVSYLPEGLSLKSVSVKDGVATVVVGTSAQSSSIGTCRSIAYRSQLTSTMKQFPNVRDIVFKVGDAVAQSSSSR